MEYEHLTADERYQIAELKSQGLTQKSIAEKLMRSPSTISRELQRNRLGKQWLPAKAHNQARLRLEARGSGNVKRVDKQLIAHVKKHLRSDQWSPEQISERLKHEGKQSMSHTWIYGYVKQDKQHGGSLYLCLRSKKIRRRRYGTKHKGKPKIADRIGIEERPQVVDERRRMGDWEGDTIIGARCKGTIVTLVDRVTRKLILAKAPCKKPNPITKIIINKLKPFKAFNQTLTLDNGGEFSGHKEVSSSLGISVYFARPYCSHERGTNENTNGLIRQYLPKGIPLDNITRKKLQQIEKKLNNRPRRCLGYKTPNEVFNQMSKNEGIALRC